MGHFKLADEEALVINLRTGGAGYFIVPITNWWGTTNDVQKRTASMNKPMVPTRTAPIPS